MWAAGAPVQRYDWWEGEHYVEELSMDPGAIRMERFAAGMSLLDTHNPYSMDDRLGVVLPGSVRIENGLGIATVQFSRKTRADELFQDVIDGMPFPVSVGYRTHAYERTEASDTSIARLTATDWEPMELSAVPIPADPAAHSRSEETKISHVKVAVKRRNEDTTMPQPNKTGRRTTNDSNAGRRSDGGEAEGAQTEGQGEDTQVEDDQVEGGEAAEDEAEDEAGQRAAPRRPAPRAQRSAQPAADPAPSQATIDAAVRAGIAQDHQRQSDIRALAARVPGIDATFVETAVRAGTSLADFRSQMLDNIVQRQEQTPTFPHSPGRVSDGNRETRRSAIVNALSHRHNPGVVELTDAGRNYRGLTLLEIVRDTLSEDGVNVRGMSRDELAARAFHSTSDFPIILQQVIRGSLRAAYEAYPQTFQPFARRTTAPDFKEIRSVQLSEGPRLLKVNEHGEYKRGTLRESQQAYSIATYGRIIGVTRQLLINDDLGVFTRIPQLYGQSIAQLESDLVWSVFIANALMADGNALFSPAHANVDDAAVLSPKSLGSLRQKMTSQMGMDGQTRLALRPKFLIVGTKLEYLAEQILAPTSVIYPQAPGGVTPDSLKKFQLIVEPRLDDIGSGADKGYGFFLAADPSQIDTVEYAYLEGQEGAYMETKEGWDVDGMEVKCRLDFGATAQDWKGLAWNPGLAPTN